MRSILSVSMFGGLLFASVWSSSSCLAQEKTPSAATQQALRDLEKDFSHYRGLLTLATKGGDDKALWIPKVLTFLNDKNPSTQSAAAACLILHSPDHFAEAVKVLEASIRETKGRSFPLQSLQPMPKQLQPFLEKWSRDPEPGIAIAACQGLVQLGVDLAPLILKEFASQDAKTRALAVRKMISINVGKDTAAYMNKALEDPDFEVRFQALEFFRSPRSDGKYSPQVLSVMAEALARPDDRFRLPVISQLEGTGPFRQLAIPRELVPGLERALADEKLGASGPGLSSQFRGRVALMLTRAGSKSPQLVAHFREALKKPPRDREAIDAVTALCMWEHDTPELVEPLLAHMKVVGKGVFYNHYRALARLGPAAIAPLEEWMKDLAAKEDVMVYVGFAEAGDRGAPFLLKNFDKISKFDREKVYGIIFSGPKPPRDGRAAPEMAELIFRGVKSGERLAELCLDRCPQEQVMPFLLEMKDAVSDHFKANYVVTLLKYPYARKDIVPILQRYSRDPDVETVRAHALAALNCYEPLPEDLLKETVAKVSLDTALRLLSTLDADFAPALPVLLERLPRKNSPPSLLEAMSRALANASPDMIQPFAALANDALADPKLPLPIRLRLARVLLRAKTETVAPLIPLALEELKQNGGTYAEIIDPVTKVTRVGGGGPIIWRPKEALIFALGDKAKPAVAELSRLFDHPNYGVRFLALQAACALDAAQIPAARKILDGLRQHQHSEIAGHAKRLLAVIDPAEKEITAWVLDNVRSPNPEGIRPYQVRTYDYENNQSVRVWGDYYFLDTVECLGPRAKAVTPQLQEMLAEANLIERKIVLARTLWAVEGNPESLLPFVRELLAGGREFQLDGLRYVQQFDAKSARALLPLLQDNCLRFPDLRAATLRSMRRIEPNVRMEK